MKREPGAYLWDVAQGCHAIQGFLAGATFDRYQMDLMLKSAVERQLINIGEALAQLTRVAPDLAARVPEHRQVIAFRNVLVHGYARLRDDEVWRAIEQSLPGLSAATESLLAESQPPDAG